MIYVLTWQGDDPFVAGGVPIGAYRSEQDAWDTAAENAALGAYEQRRIFPRRTWADCIADIASGYGVFPLEVTG